MTTAADLARVMGSEIEAAIEQSIAQNEIVHVTLSTTSDISTVAAYAGDHADNVDYVRENDGSYDMYGWSDEMEAAGKGEMEWRLKVTIAAVAVDPFAKLDGTPSDIQLKLEAAPWESLGGEFIPPAH